MKIVLTGSIAFDYLMRFPGNFKDHILPEHLEKISLSFLVEDMVRQYGGVGANIAYTLALLGEKPLLFSTAGQDFPEYGRRLEQVGVDVSGVRVSDTKFTASFFVNTDLSNAQIASFYTGAMADSADLPLSEAGAQPGDFVVNSPSDPRAMARYIREAKDLGLRSIFDPGQQIIRMDKDALREGILNAHGLFVNEYEFELLQKHTGLSADDILCHPEFTVITLGRDGARVYTCKEDLHVPIIDDAQVVDPTGVGDAFRAGFLFAYMRGKSMRLCGEMGTAAAAYCIARNGTQNHKFTLEEFIKYFRQHFDDQGELDNLNKKE
ncbi:MAG: carbohydrate kinase family protein [Anaerolineaceae bacterium]|jgi:adenosine kinase|nr:carbohydrate kinase family protein [Anaerolineaceae bacterium]